MVLLGAGMGLGLASPWEGQGAEAKTIGIAIPQQILLRADEVIE